MARRVPRVVCVHAMQASLRPTKRAFAQGFPEAEVHDLLDSSLSVDVGGNGLSPAMHERFVALGRYALDGARADAILFTCSAFGSCIEAVQADISEIPVLKPNESLQRAAVESSNNDSIGVLAMFEPTLPSISRELGDLADICGKRISIESRYVDGALARLGQGDDDGCAELIARDAVALVRGSSDISTVALAMFSMAFARPAVEAALASAFPGREVRVLTSPDAAVADLRARLAQ